MAKDPPFREVRSGASYLSQHDMRLFFGLGGRERVERAVIRWPHGLTDTLTDLAADRLLIVTEGDRFHVMGRFPYGWLMTVTDVADRSCSVSVKVLGDPGKIGPLPPPANMTLPSRVSSVLAPL